MKIKVLFVTPTLEEKAACGVGLYGKLWSDALLDLNDFDFKVIYTDSVEETFLEIKNFLPQVIFYMYHVGATKWMENPIFRENFPNAKHIAILHDVQQHEIDNFNPEVLSGGIPYVITCNPTLKGNEKVFISNKLLPPSPTIKYQESSITTIGYQGFAGSHKGIETLASIVNEEFDECIFKLHIPPAFYFDRDGHETNKRIQEVRNKITKPGIKLEFSHNMMSSQDLVNWLSQNTINCYLYDYPLPAGLASAPDYALAARRPIAVSNNMMLKHFSKCTPSVIINEPFNLKQIIANGITPLEDLYKDYSKESFLSDWSNAINHFISQ
jgi:hypothetical protein